jgi:hypothetical protein
MEYLKAFKKIEEDILNNPYLELIEKKYNPGIGENELGVLKDELFHNMKFFKSIKMNKVFNFYKECNGLTLSWGISSKLDDKAYCKLKEEISDLSFPDDRNIEIGKINIRPFDEVFLYDPGYFETKPSNEYQKEFNGFIYEGNTFGDLIFIFDLFSEESCMAFVPDEDNQEPKVILLSDRYVVWDSSRITFFDSYINFLTASRGVIANREMIYDCYRGDKLEPIFYETVPYGTDVESMIFRIESPNIS